MKENKEKQPSKNILTRKTTLVATRQSIRQGKMEKKNLNEVKLSSTKAVAKKAIKKSP